MLACLAWAVPASAHKLHSLTIARARTAARRYERRWDGKVKTCRRHGKLRVRCGFIQPLEEQVEPGWYFEGVVDVVLHVKKQRIVISTPGWAGTGSERA